MSACRLPCGWVEVISDRVVELTGDVLVVDGLFASLSYGFSPVVYIRLCTSASLVFVVYFVEMPHGLFLNQFNSNLFTMYDKLNCRSVW